MNSAFYLGVAGHNGPSAEYIMLSEPRFRRGSKIEKAESVINKVDGLRTTIEELVEGYKGLERRISLTEKQVPKQ